ncbi:hypothetical protein AbraIFM66950_010530 [Aspergillus brasiliensis]|nr:hypothetical protein AbraIFM66950_010530 [Aspergillus brasiliensis]
MRRTLSNRLHTFKDAGTWKLRRVRRSPSPSNPTASNRSSISIESPAPAPTERPHTKTEPAVTSPYEPTELISDLWDRAEENLQMSPHPGTRKVMVAYLSLLESATESNLAARGTLLRQKQLLDLTTRQLHAVEEKKWLTGESIWRDLANNVLGAKDLISTAAAAEPHVALACAGLSLIIKLLLKPGQEYQALLAGLEYVSQIIRQFNVMERRYLSRKHSLAISPDQAVQFVDGLEAAFLKLYTGVLEFQARAICHLTKHSVTRAFKDIFEVDSWEKMVDAIKESESTCRNFIRVIDSEKLHTGLAEHKSQLHNIQKDTKQIYTALLEQNMEQNMKRKELQQREKWNRFLAALFTSRYEDHKDRNQDRIEGTCEWSTTHPLFTGWKESEASNLLWISADPGCGKSVLVKYLIDHVVPTTNDRTTCYFFFKSDSSEQQSASNALCALLRQLLLQRPALREVHQWASERYAIDGSQLINSFSALWDILIKVTATEDKQVVCILDALDECAGGDRPQLTQALDKFYRSERRKGALKFLITSRPYAHIQREFQLLKNSFPTIHLSGKDDAEANKIEREINLVVQKRVEEIGAKLQLEEYEQSFLQDQLLLIPNRTYLWVTLIFDVIENSLSYTNNKVRQIIKTLPRTVDEAYERILNQSPDQAKARRLLHVVVGATRPLTIKEMRIALAVDLRLQKHGELDLEPEGRFATTVRNLCGLFVTIVDSKIYLLHQTAKEFLVPRTQPAELPGTSSAPSFPESADKEGHCMETKLHWKHSLPSVNSNRIVLEICLSYLLLDTFEHDPERDEIDGPGQRESPINDRGEYDFLDYSAKSWTIHFRNAMVQKDAPLLPLAREICDPQSPRLKAWLRVCWEMEGEVQVPSTELMVASYFGLEAIGELLLQGEVPYLDEEDPVMRRTALSMAAGGGSERAVKLLLDAGSRSLNWRDEHGTPLLWAAEKGNTRVVRLLLDQPDIDLDLPAVGGRTPLSYAAENGHEDVVELLLDRGADTEDFRPLELTPLAYAASNGHTRIVEKLLRTQKVNVAFEDWEGNTPLLMAAREGHDGIVGLLLHVPGVDPDCRNKRDRSPLSYASENAHLPVVRLLTQTKAVDLDSRDRFYGRTPLLWAAEQYENEDVVQHLIDAGAKDIECQGTWPKRSALSHACAQGNDTVVRLLLETGLANPNSMSAYGRTPLSFASESGHTSIVKELLALESVSPDLADTTYGRTPLSWAAAKGHVEVVQLLLKTDAVDLWSRDLMYHRTPGEWAACNGHRGIADWLQYTQPEEPGGSEESGRNSSQAGIEEPPPLPPRPELRISSPSSESLEMESV